MRQFTRSARYRGRKYCVWSLVDAPVPWLRLGDFFKPYPSPEVEFCLRKSSSFRAELGTGQQNDVKVRPVTVARNTRGMLKARSCEYTFFGGSPGYGWGIFYGI